MFTGDSNLGISYTAEGASRVVQEDGNECLLLCVNANKNAALAVQKLPPNPLAGLMKNARCKQGKITATTDRNL